MSSGDRTATAELDAATLGAASSIPAELRALPQWVTWRLEDRGGKPTKVPYRADGKGRASTTDPATWATFEQALAAAPRFDGIGFVFTREAGVIGVDIDKCVAADTGAIEPWAREIIGDLDGYTEVSPSGTGIHVLVRGTWPEGARNRGGRVEVYSEARYFTVVGNGQGELREAQDALERLRASYLAGERPTPAPAPPVTTDSAALTPDDMVLLAKAFGAKNGEKIRALWEGDTSAHGSQSEADLALCSHLAYWAEYDAERVDRLFRHSGLYREKWERDDYRARTLGLALERDEPEDARSSSEPGSREPGSRESSRSAEATGVAVGAGAGAQEPPTMSLGELLDQLVAYLKRFIHFANDEQADCLALWVTHTWFFDREVDEVTPYLAVLSAEKRSGKSTLLRVLDAVCRNGWRGVSPSAAATYRMIEQNQPTMLIDEVDTIYRRGRENDNGDLQAVINAGYEAGLVIPRMGGRNKTTLEMFSPFCPKVLAGIGLSMLPETVQDRCIVIEMKRKTASEPTHPAHRVAIQTAVKPLRAELTRWFEAPQVARKAEVARRSLGKSPESMRVLATLATLSTSQGVSPKQYEIKAELDDRAYDLWVPLLSIAGAAGLEWAQRADRAASVLSGAAARPGDDTHGIRLLSALFRIFEARPPGETAISTRALCRALHSDDDAPTPHRSTWWNDFASVEGEPPKPAMMYLSRTLKEFGVQPRQMWQDGANQRGYDWADLAEVWERYLSIPPERSLGSLRSLDPAFHAGSRLATSGDFAPEGDEEVARNGPSVEEMMAAYIVEVEPVT